ncbi:MAG: hypothetical protein RLN86_13705 [Cyclobacteriaceae bacterium]
MKIDFTRIKQQKVKDLVRLHQLQEVSDFQKVKYICYSEAEGGYRSHHKSFIIKASIEKVWEAYQTIHPREAWGGNMISIGLVYCKQSNTIIYPEDSYDGAKEGQILFVHLNLLGGLVQLGVAHAIHKIDSDSKVFTICYVEKGSSVGSQYISMKETAEGHTLVSHDTKYKSDSTFRDRYLYPTFHEKALTIYHENIKRKVESV